MPAHDGPPCAVPARDARLQRSERASWLRRPAYSGLRPPFGSRSSGPRSIMEVPRLLSCHRTLRSGSSRERRRPWRTIDPAHRLIHDGGICPRLLDAHGDNGRLCWAKKVSGPFPPRLPRGQEKRCQVPFRPGGTRIGIIHLPEVTANLCFGGARQNRLFITASQSLYAVYVNANGAHIA